VGCWLSLVIFVIGAAFLLPLVRVVREWVRSIGW
jgi:hypothetical protein